MSETALAAAYRALKNRLLTAGQCWGTKVAIDYSDRKDYPYAVLFWSGGGERNAIRGRDAELILTVKVISADGEQAMLGAQQIADLLNDHGEQDNASDFLYGGAFWRVLTITEESTIYVADYVSSAIPVYHAGAQYRLIMEAR